MSVVETWLEYVCGSEETRRHYTYFLSRFLETIQISPEEIIKQWETAKYSENNREILIDKFRDFWRRNIESYTISLTKKGCTDLSVKAMVAPVRSFFNFYEISLKLRGRQKDKNPVVKYHNRAIQPGEIRKICEHSLLRDRTFYIIMTESGLRPNTIVQLKYKLIKEDFEANRLPMKISVPKELLKDRVGDRFSFVGEDGFNLLKEYLSTRQLTNEDYIFAPESDRIKGEHLTPEAFSSQFNRTAKKLDLTEEKNGKPKDLRLYCLRKYFRNNIKIDAGYREFMMGHRFGTDEHYIEPEKIREAYREAYPSIRIFKPETDKTIEEIKTAIEQKLRTEYEERIKKLEQERAELKASLEQRIGKLEAKFTGAEFLRDFRDQIKAEAVAEAKKLVLKAELEKPKRLEPKKVGE